MNIVFSTQFYQEAVGGTLWVYDIAHTLLRRGHAIRIHAGAIGEIFERTDERITVSARTSIPDKFRPDIIIASHPHFSLELIENTHAPVISVCHSEYFETDAPIIHSKVAAHIVVDDSLIPWIKENYSIQEPVLLRNGVDLTRFKSSDLPKEYILVPGAMNPLRYKMASEIIKKFPDEQIVFLGYGTNVIPKLKNTIIKGQQWNIEDFYAKAKLVCGLINGRVQYEAWACGLEYLAFDIHANTVYVQKPDNFEQDFSLETIVDRLERLIYNICEGTRENVSYQENAG